MDMDRHEIPNSHVHVVTRAPVSLASMMRARSRHFSEACRPSLILGLVRDCQRI